MAAFDARNEDKPDPNDALDPEQFSATNEDYWNPPELMIDILPPEVVRLGEESGAPGMGTWVHLHISQESEVLSILRSLGWTAKRDDDLVRRAGGDWIEENFPPGAAS